MPHPFFLNSLAWNFGLGMTWLPVPLYAHAQGLSDAEIGALFAFPVFVQAPLNLIGGAYTDRIGGRRILIWSSAAMILTGLWFMFAEGFWMLMLGQLAMILARASFWPATWSRLERLAPGHPPPHGFPRRPLRPGHRLLRTRRIRPRLRLGDRGYEALGVF